MCSVIELRQNRSFINANFQGYKLSLDPIASIKQDLNIYPLKAKSSEDQYSYLHAELFSLHNSLVQDPWNRNDSYFINEIGEIIKCSYNNDVGKPNPFYTIYKLNNISNRQAGDYPVTFQFVSENLCILCDGIDEIQLLDTKERSKSEVWICIFNYKTTDFKKFIIKNARLDIINDKKIVNLILQYIISNDDESGRHLNELKHLCLLEKNGTWEFCMKNSLICKGSLKYCAFENDSKALIVCSNKEIKPKIIEQAPKEDNLQEIEKVTTNSQDETHSSSLYTWSQTESDIIIKFDKTAINRDNFKVISTKTNLTIQSCNNVVFEGELFGKVDSDVTTWTWENDYLELVLVKEDENLRWSYLVRGGPSETISDKKEEDFVNPISGQPVSDLQSQMEECDFPRSNEDDEDYTIERICLNSLKPTHKIFLGKCPPLFSTCLNANNPPAIVTRQDVDACVWSIQQLLSQHNLESGDDHNDDSFHLYHEGNLHAFGYVQASKQQKKFLNCSPDLQNIVICESYRHIFIYKLNYGGTNELRNRNGPQITVGKQHVVTLDDNAGEILGMTITNNFVVLLTEKKIVYLQIN